MINLTVLLLSLSIMGLLPFADSIAAEGDINALSWGWNTFMGSWHGDYGFGIAADDNGNVYITGVSKAAWGSQKMRMQGIRTY